MPPNCESWVNRKTIQADFNGGQITSDAGALLLREVDQRIGLVDAIDACPVVDPVVDPEQAKRVEGSEVEGSPVEGPVVVRSCRRS